jgi:hypothetical protein
MMRTAFCGHSCAPAVVANRIAKTRKRGRTR